MLCSKKIMEGICNGSAGVLMHGPTFMANPLAARVACASVDRLLAMNWRETVHHIETVLKDKLLPLARYDSVADVRVLGTIGVVETRNPVDMAVLQKSFVDDGVWIRPFGRLIYVMVPYIISDGEIAKLAAAVEHVLQRNLV